MNPIEKRWQIAAPITPQADENLKPHPQILRQILFNRGQATAEDAAEYLAAPAPADADPFQLLGMEAAVDRLLQAIQGEEKVVVYGDYDADGVTSTALMVHTLTVCGAVVDSYIPNRFKEGYGLNKEALSQLHEEGAKVVISVDCGIRALPEADHARSLGLDLIITDHHSVGPELPSAFAVVNPKQHNDPYPYKNLAGVGVAYKVASALLAKMPDVELPPETLLDLVSIGTVADMVPLVGENRSLVRQGLMHLRNTQRQGLRSLIGIAGLEPKILKAEHIGFNLGPRLNAAGRLDSAQTALDLLLEDDVNQAGQLAQTLDNYNHERRSITQEMQVQAEEMVLKAEQSSFLVFAAHADFNPGVVGLTAARLLDTYYRPAIVGHRGKEFTRASCRSIPEFHITDALQACADLLDHFGGHAAAAGFTVRNEKLEELLGRLRKIAREQLSDLDLRPVLTAEVEVPLRDLRPELLTQLDKLQPTGYGNPAPFFVSRNMEVKKSRTVGRDKAHLKLSLSDGWVTFDAIAFRQGFWHENMPDRIDALFAFEMNEFYGRQSLQLNIKDIKPSKGK